MKKFLEQFKTEDWVVTLVGALLLVAAIFIPDLLPRIPKSLTTADNWLNAAYLYVIVAIALYLGMFLLKRPIKKLLPSLTAVFLVSLLAQVVASIPKVSYFGFESVFFSVLFGLIIRNLFHIPEWMKPAIQSEYYIKIGVVCLGATVLFSDVMKSGSLGLVQAILVVSIVWFFAYKISRRLGVDERSAMVLSSGMSICGVSAAITAARVANADDKKVSYIISLILIVVVPMIYLMPWLGNHLLPLIIDDPEIIQEVTGAWIGGTIDTTSGVAASSAIMGEVANQHAVIIKAAQNVLIGVVAFFIAIYLSARNGEKSTDARPSLSIVWEKFPKFIIGFVAASLVFSLCQSNGVFHIDPSNNKLVEPRVAKMFSSLFFSLAFVCVGLETRLKDIISRENRNMMKAFLIAQSFNIIITFVIAFVFFGILKPMWA
ncbi:MAG: putative sulfate exporter family transporter [Tidjanibacter sp.]|nr:putative sulfate exporter family transporter [Tidjanibacter sp.]